MSGSESFFVLNSENSLVGEKKPKVDKTAKSSFPSTTRRTLGDISNLPQRPKSFVQNEEEQIVSNFTKEYIEQLQKENTALMKLLADRNNIIELSNFELQKLRIKLQKVQLQNLQLAQANSQTLVELNFGKDRLKALQHELGCRNALLKAKELEIEVGTSKSSDAGEPSEVDRDGNKQRNTSKKQQSKSMILSSVKPNQLKETTGKKRVSLRRQSARFNSEEHPPEDKVEVGTNMSEDPGESSEPDGADNLQQSQSLDPSTVKQYQLEEKVENKRVSLRRQSARFKSEDPEPTEDKIEVGNAELPAHSLSEEQILEDGKGGSSGRRDFGAKELPRSSIGRPSRLAAKKVQSYKEIPVNVKMRRTG